MLLLSMRIGRFPAGTTLVHILCTATLSYKGDAAKSYSLRVTGVTTRMIR